MALSLGRIDEAIGISRRALEQDPLSSSIHFNLGAQLHAAKRFAEAEASFWNELEIQPDRPAARALLSLSLLAQGRGDEALAEAARDSDEGFRLWASAIVHHALGRGSDADAALRELMEKYEADMAAQIAEVHAARGDADATFEWLERAHAQRDPGLAGAQASPFLRPYHVDPRWPALLKKLGFEA